MEHNQIYEDYWKVTNAFTDYNGERFIRTLSIIINFIDEGVSGEFKNRYKELQSRVNEYSKMNMASVRKSINQMVKFGFVEPRLESYHFLAKRYLEATTDRQRANLLSKIVYSNSKFNSSAASLDRTNVINFLIKTMECVGQLTIDDLQGLMITDIASYKKGYLTSEELSVKVEEAQAMGFLTRKYNQIDHFLNLLGKLDDIQVVNQTIYFKEDTRQIIEAEVIDSHKRDPYLHRLYKSQLKEESVNILGKAKCMVEKLEYPVLIASHIKPFIDSTEGEAYDVNNGLLLSRTVDSLFDLGYISFEDSGAIIFSEEVAEDVKRFWESYEIPCEFLNNERIAFLNYHRNNVLRH